MLHLRYGRIRITDCLSSLIVPVMCLILGIVAMALGLYTSGSIYFAASGFALLTIIHPYLERYSICDNVIVIKRLFASSKIDIPANTVIVITQADIHPPFSHQSLFIKEELAISILQEMPLNEALNLLHGKHPSQHIYTNSTIENSVDEWRFVYSFIQNDTVLTQLFQRTNCCVIIPASISGKVDVESLPTEVYIDSDY